MISLIPVIPAAAYVQTGLVFNIDSRDSASLDPVNPTVWNDISGSGATGAVYGVDFDPEAQTMVFADSVGCESEFVEFNQRTFDFSQGITVDFAADFGAPNYFERIIDFGNGATADNILVGRYGSEDNLSLAIYVGSGSSGGFATNGDPLASGGTHHYTVTVDSSHVAHWYVDGVEVETKFNGTISDNGQDIFALPGTVSREFIEVGMSLWCDPDYEGTIDFVRIYDRGLTSDEVVTNFEHDAANDSTVDASTGLAATGWDSTAALLIGVGAVGVGATILWRRIARRD